MHSRLLTVFFSFPVFLVAQNSVPNGDFELGPLGWTMTAFNDPLGTTGIAPARVTGNGPSVAVFGNFQTLTSVMSATYRGAPFTVAQAGTIPVGFHVMFEKQVTTPIPQVTVNRVELRIFDATNVRVFLGTQNAPNQTGLFERVRFTGSWVVAAPGTYTAEVFMRHSNLAGIPFVTWVDDVFVGEPNARVFGQGCAGSGGTTPLIGSVQVPAIGTTNYAIHLYDAYGPTAALFALDLSDTTWPGGSLPFALGGGCSLLTGSSVVVGQLANGTGPGTGTAVQPIPIPNNPQFTGLRLFAQWGVADPVAANPFGLVTTAGLRFTVQ